MPTPPDDYDHLADAIEAGTLTDPNDLPLGSTTWAPVNLEDALAGHEPPPPAILARTDGICLLYAGETHQFAGEPESLKSWAALIAVAEVINNAGDALVIDFEDSATRVVGRLRALGVTPDIIRQHLAYIRPNEPLRTPQGVMTAGDLDLTVALRRPFQLVIIDGVTEAMVTEGLDLNSNADVAAWNRRLPKRIADATGAAVVVIDHVTKNREGQGRFAIGGQHKLAGLTGAAYRFEVTRRLARATKDPVDGIATITVTKDRPGHIRANTADDQIGTLEMTSYPDGGVSARIVPPGTSSTVPPMVLLDRIARHLDTYDGSSGSAIERAVPGRAENTRAALRWMVDNAWVTVTKVGASHRHSLTPHGHQQTIGTVP